MTTMEKLLSGKWIDDLPEPLALIYKISKCKDFKLYGLTLDQIRLVIAYYQIHETDPVREISREKVFK